MPFLLGFKTDSVCINVTRLEYLKENPQLNKYNPTLTRPLSCNRNKILFWLNDDRNMKWFRQLSNVCCMHTHTHTVRPNVEIYPCAAPLWEQFSHFFFLRNVGLLHTSGIPAGNNMRVFLTLQLCVSTKAKTNIHLLSKLKQTEL